MASSPVHGGGGRWYDRDNLKRHWKAVCGGALLPCHETDQNAPLYGGSFPKGKVEARVCVGVQILALREVEVFMTAGNNHQRYRARGGAMSLLGLASWATRLFYSGAVLHIGGELLRLCRVKDDKRIGLAWKETSR